MGNVASMKSSATSVSNEGVSSSVRYGEGGSFNKSFKGAVGKLPPLHVVKDSAVQTDCDAPFCLKSSIFSVGGLFILVGGLYFGICYLIITSNYVQSLIVYSHLDKEHQPLQNLLHMGLPEAKNIKIITEDGVMLHGWHLMHPGADLLQGNTLPDEERDVFFDQKLAHSQRVILYFHGNSHTRGQGFRLRKIKQMAVHLDAHVIAFDYRGFGDSEGHPSEAGTHLDARAVVHYVDNIVRRYNPQATGYLASAPAVDALAGTDAGAQAEGMFSQLLGLLESRRDLLAEKIANMIPESGSSNRTRGGADSSVGAAEPGSVFIKDTVVPAVQRNQPHLYIYGHSLGAAIATAIAMEVSNLKPGALSALVLDCPFTKLPDAIRHHPLTKPFRTFPWIFNLMVTNLQFIYPNIDRIQHLSAPLLMLHGDNDIKINASHSRLLYLKATSTAALADEASVTQIGVNHKNVTFVATPGTSVDCVYPVEREVVHGAGHNEVYATRAWLALLPAFLRTAEKFVADSNGVC